MIQHNVELTGQLCGRVPHHCHKAASLVNLLVVTPCLHNGAVVDTEDDHLVHAFCLQSVRVLKVAGDLRRGSGGREGAGQAYNWTLMWARVVVSSAQGNG